MREYTVREGSMYSGTYTIYENEVKLSPVLVFQIQILNSTDGLLMISGTTR